MAVQLVAATACDLPGDGIIQCHGDIDREVNHGVCIVSFTSCEGGVEYRLECIGEPAVCVCVEDGVTRENDDFASDQSPCSLDNEETLERMVELGCGWPIEA